MRDNFINAAARLQSAGVGPAARRTRVITSDKWVLCQREAHPACRARAAAPAIERSPRTPPRCPDRSRPDRPTRESPTNIGGAGRASHRPGAPQSSY